MLLMVLALACAPVADPPDLPADVPEPAAATPAAPATPATTPEPIKEQVMPTPTPAPLGTMPEVPYGDTMLEIGLCADGKEIFDIRPKLLADGRGLYEVVCGQFAYQEALEYAWASPITPIRTTSGSLLRVLGLPTLAPDGTLTWLAKARGAGDCGDWFTYKLQGKTAALVEHRSRACSDEPVEEIDPTTWPPADRGHCATTEEVFFSCAAKNKHLSICGNDAGAQYRFGPVGKPELVWPDKAGKGMVLEELTLARARGWSARFTNVGVHYEVLDMNGSGAVDALENNFKGVRVSQGAKILGQVACTSEPRSQWPLLVDALKP